MTETEAIKSLIDLGGQAILLFLLWKVWDRLTDVTDRLIELAVELRAQNQLRLADSLKESQANLKD